MKRIFVLTTTAILGLMGGMTSASQVPGGNGYGNEAAASTNTVIDCQVTDASDMEEVIYLIQEAVKRSSLAGCNLITIPITCKPGTLLPDNGNQGTDSVKPETGGDQSGADSVKPETGGDQSGADSVKPETGGDQSGADSVKPETGGDQSGVDSVKPETGGDQSGADSDNQETDDNQTGTEALSYAEQVVALVNEERAKAGLNPVTLDKSLEAAALIRAKETEIQFSHSRPDGSSFSTVLNDLGIQYRGVGENIAWGQSSPEAVMNGWMNSSGHRANILNPSFTRIGVGYYQNAAGRNYWTQLFVY